MSKKYRVSIRQVRQIDITVEATNLEDAMENAWRMVEGKNIAFRDENIRLTDVIPTGRIEELDHPATHRVIDLSTGETQLLGTYDECVQFIDGTHDYNLTVVDR